MRILHKIPKITSTTEFQRQPSKFSNIKDDEYHIITKGSKELAVLVSIKTFQKMIDYIRQKGDQSTTTTSSSKVTKNKHKKNIKNKSKNKQSQKKLDKNQTTDETHENSEKIQDQIKLNKSPEIPDTLLQKLNNLDVIEYQNETRERY